MARITFLLLLLWVGAAVSTVVDLQKRIIGGTECERQYHVLLRTVGANGSCSFCGGSLISQRWILTAAHCVEPGGTVFAFLNVGGTFQKVQITAQPEIYTDKDNNNSDRFHDLMLLQLPGNTNIPPVPLPRCDNQPKISESVEIAGRAATSGDLYGRRKPDMSPTLHCADIKVVDCEDLRQTLLAKAPKVYQVKMYQHWFCGQSPGVDICYGDSGGGVVYEGKIYGVISFLGDRRYVCRKAAAFMDLCNPQYTAWIEKITTEHKKL